MTDWRSLAARRADLPVIALLSSIVITVGCRRSNQPPKPSFAALFPTDSGELMTTSSPAFADLDGDGIRDIEDFLHNLSV